ncbi:MAG: 4Fe-4S dicluster domain-containing protein [Caldilineae bacterium]|nr:MAG: 4Fe-4S dicluster domain-containing protein [Caldilineae bacterium]
MIMAKAMLIDLTRCIGCRACQAACKQWNDLPAEQTRNNGSYENPPRRSAKTWTTVTFHEITQPPSEAGEEEGFAWVFAKRQCMHCEHPACASACIVGALHKTPDGPVLYDDKKCMGCRYCMIACPYGVPTFEWHKAVPYIRKCTMCADRIALGMEPACAKACPTDAIQFGEREALIVEGRKRIKASPAKYVDHIYGEKEAGGADMLYLSSVPFNELGFPELGEERLDRYAGLAMLAVPPAIVGVTALMAGTYWIIKRREQMMAQAAAEGPEAVESPEEEVA